MLLNHVGRLGILLAFSLAISGCTPKVCRFDPAITKNKINAFTTRAHAKPVISSRVPDAEREAAILAERAVLAPLEDTAYTAVMQVCRQSLQCQSSKGDQVRWVTLAVTVGGSIAGAVVVPALTTASAAGNAEWIAGLSGFSGGVNGYLANLQQTGLSFEARVMERARFLVKFEQLIEGYSAAIEDTVKATHLNKLQAHCIAYGTSMGLVPEVDPTPPPN